MEWSATRERGAAGLACLIHRDIAQKIQKPEGISERLLNIKLELKIGKNLYVSSIWTKWRCL